MKMNADDKVTVEALLEALLDCKGIFIETTTKSYPTASDLLIELRKK